MSAKRAAIYCRISQDRSGAGLGVARQREDCERLAQSLDWEVVETFTDNDVSAYAGKRRPAYDALIDGIRSGRVQAVLAWHEDRLHRSPREIEDYIDVCASREVPTHFAQAGELDLATASGRMIARIRGAVSRQESEHKSERTRRAQRQAAERGRWLGGTRPFGWQITSAGPVVVAEEAREVQRATAALLAGASLGSIVRDLNSRGVTSTMGKPWNYTTLRQVLSRGRNAGLVEYGGEVMSSDWPPIITEDVHRAVVSVLSNPARRRSQSNRARWLLAGIAECSQCGAALKSATVAKNRAKGTSRTVYRCPTSGRGHVARSASDLDNHVELVVLGLLSRPDISALTNAPLVDTEALLIEATAIRAQQGEAAELFAHGQITGAQLAKITRELEERLDRTQLAMADLSRSSTLRPFVGRDPADVWRNMPLDKRRAVVRELMRVRVLPTGRRGATYDPTRVEISPRSRL